MNSRATHTFASEAMPYSPETARPGVPTSDGITTVNPAATTSLANGGNLRGDAGDLVDHDDAGPDATAEDDARTTVAR